MELTDIRELYRETEKFIDKEVTVEQLHNYIFEDQITW